MIIAVEDTSYRCKNCDSFSQCKYYHHRRPDSHICKEFRNDWRQRDVLDKISADVRPNIHGYWIKDEALSITIDMYKCSICSSLSGAKHYNFCPKCGADMRPEPYKGESED